MGRLSVSDDEFRALATRTTEFAARYLAGLNSMATFPETSGRGTQEIFGGALPEQGMGPAAFDALPEIAKHVRPNSPRFFGYVLGSGEPVAALAAYAAS